VTEKDRTHQAPKGQARRSKPGQKRSSFLSVRLTGEELDRLRDLAARQGIGPSTFVRTLLTGALERETRAAKPVTAGTVKEAREAYVPGTTVKYSWIIEPEFPFIEIGRNLEPVIKGKGTPVWALVSYATRGGMSPREISDLWDGFVTEEEVTNALAYWRAHPNMVDDKQRPDDGVPWQSTKSG